MHALLSFTKSSSGRDWTFLVDCMLDIPAVQLSKITSLSFPNVSVVTLALEHHHMVCFLFFFKFFFLAIPSCCGSLQVLQYMQGMAVMLSFWFALPAVAHSVFIAELPALSEYLRMFYIPCWSSIFMNNIYWACLYFFSMERLWKHI